MADNVTPMVGDLFEKAQTLVNTVNCVGVMGKGIALSFKERYPAMYREYVQLCERGEVRLGRPYLWVSAIPPWILNFPTKEHWRAKTRVEDTESVTGLTEGDVSSGLEKAGVVAPLGESGSGGRIRTYDMAVNSRPLYR